MPADRRVALRPIGVGDLQRIAEFLHRHLDPRLSAEEWRSAVEPSWRADQPNYGYMLVEEDRVVGAHLAFYSAREVGGRNERFCNLAAWCVLESHRSHSLRLLRALLAQPGYTFTDLTPSGNVISVNERLKFRHLDTTTVLVPNLPWPLSSRRGRVVRDHSTIEKILTGRELAVFRDHSTNTAARHLVLERDGRQCYVVYRRVRRKRLPMFGMLLYVGDREAFTDLEGLLYRHLLLRRAIVVTLVELRQVLRRPTLSLTASSSHPKMYRSSTVAPEDIDYLYSELITCVAR